MQMIWKSRTKMDFGFILPSALAPPQSEPLLLYQLAALILHLPASNARGRKKKTPKNNTVLSDASSCSTWCTLKCFDPHEQHGAPFFPRWVLFHFVSLSSPWNKFKKKRNVKKNKKKPRERAGLAPPTAHVLSLDGCMLREWVERSGGLGSLCQICGKTGFTC